MESEDDDAIAVAIIALALGHEGQARRQKKRRRKRRNQLRRCDLHQTPRTGTARGAIYEARNDQAFILTTGFDVATFHQLLQSFEVIWNATPIPRNDVEADGESRPDRRPLSPSASLALVLHYLNSTMPEHSLQQIFAVTPSVCSRYLRFGLSVLRQVLKGIEEARVVWPSSKHEFKDYAAMIHHRHNFLYRGFCFVDGLNLPVAESLNVDVQNAYYNGWTCSHYCSCVLAFAPDGRIIYACVNAPGSWHDAAIAQDLYNLLAHATPEGYYAIADTAFPHNHKRIQGRIRTPLKRTDRLPRDLASHGRARELRQLEEFNNQLVSARQAAEWGMRAFQGSFSRLKLPLPADDHAHRLLVLEVCVGLHQLRTTLVGINQFASVYEYIWRETDTDALLYDHFATVLFKDIAKNDRIARYYCLEHNIIETPEEVGSLV